MITGAMDAYDNDDIYKANEMEFHILSKEQRLEKYASKNLSIEMWLLEKIDIMLK